MADTLFGEPAPIGDPYNLDAIENVCGYYAISLCARGRDWPGHVDIYDAESADRHRFRAGKWLSDTALNRFANEIRRSREVA